VLGALFSATPKGATTAPWISNRSTRSGRACSSRRRTSPSSTTRATREIDEAIEAIGDPDALASERARAARRVAVYEKLHAEWQARTQTRADLYVEQEQRKYSAPLPKKGLD
jgi:hypothetical protein